MSSWDLVSPRKTMTKFNQYDRKPTQGDNLKSEDASTHTISTLGCTMNTKAS